MAKNYKVNGTVHFAGKSNEEKNTISLLLTDERAKELATKLELDNLTYDGTPIKETEEGVQLLKTSSKFPVKIYENGEESTDITLTDIGEGSEVSLFIGIDTSYYKPNKKTYQVAYLKSIDVLNLIQSEIFNPFAKDSDVEEV